MYRIGEAAHETGLSVHTIRFYEGSGLLPVAARAESGYRQYDDGDLRLLRLVHRARALGLPLDEIRALVTGVHGGTCGEYASRLSVLIARQRTVVEERIAELERLRTELDIVAAEAESATRSDQPMAGCTCCLLIDDSPSEAYCMPVPLTPAERFRAETLELLQCDIDSRPEAPTIDDLAPGVKSITVAGDRLVIGFEPSAAESVAAFAAAECVCCGGLAWQVEQTDVALMLAITGTAEQLAALQRAFTDPRLRRRATPS